MTRDTNSKNAFYRLSLWTLIAVFFLILVGGIVRSTGSGMGCPDWPTCFGSVVPPTSIDQLPENYKEVYSDYRHRKNQKFAKYLSALGMKSTADQLLNDERVRDEADFNVLKTWIEYVNRIVGVIIGFLIFAVFVSSLRFLKTERRITIVAFLTFVMVGFQGWIGSFVVSSNLTPWTITVHMFLALVIVVMLIYLVDQGKHEKPTVKLTATNGWLFGCVVVLLIQILLGTKVRESVDQLSPELPRSAWIVNVGKDFILHRSFSWLVVLFHVGLIFSLKKRMSLKGLPAAVVLLILVTILSGVGMGYFGIPPVLQPVHLLLATVTFGLLIFLFFAVNRTVRKDLVVE